VIERFGPHNGRPKALALALVTVVVAVVAVLASQEVQPAPGSEQTVDVLAERFSFSPSEIKTTVGTTLQIRLESDDTAHGFRIVGTDVNIEIPKRGRGTTTVTFKAEKAGRYTFECSQLCGAGHSFMRGVIIVSDASSR
jgi:cytochrome c oxidase subunit 2